MRAFFANFLRLFLQAFQSKGNILSEIVPLKGENEILRRAHHNSQRPLKGDLFHLTLKVPIFCSGKHTPLSE